MDHGTVARTVDWDVAGAHSDLERVTAAGVDLDDVARVLEGEGVSAFTKSFEELLTTLEDKAHTLRPG